MKSTSLVRVVIAFCFISLNSVSMADEKEIDGPIEVEDNGWVTCTELLDDLPEEKRKVISETTDVVARWSRCNRGCYERVLYRIPNDSWQAIEELLQIHSKASYLRKTSPDRRFTKRTVEEYKVAKRAYLAKVESKPIEEIELENVTVFKPDEKFATWWKPKKSDIDYYIGSYVEVQGHPFEQFSIIVGKTINEHRLIYVQFSWN